MSEPVLTKSVLGKSVLGTWWQRLVDWSAKWGWLVLIAAFGIVLKPRGRSLWRHLKEEHKFVGVRTETQKLLEAQQYEKAVIHVKTQYQEKLVKMDEEHRVMVRHLEADPEQLASYLASLHL